MTVATGDLRDSIKQAVNNAAEDAHSENLDQNAVAAPIRHLNLATNNLRKAADALPKARALKDWSEDAVRQATRAIQGRCWPGWTPEA